MSDTAWIALGSFLFSIGVAAVTGTIGIRKLTESIQAGVHQEIKQLREQLVQAELVYERRVSQVDAGLRATIHEVEFYIRDHYVEKPVFEQMIAMLSDNNANQFRSMQTQLDRIFDKLDTINSSRP